ncbi:MAG TPA: HAMP domain-containing sensor histidine kinase [Solirubrobacteraceae bacterium]|jgi:signal transduction histidine kinase|nr:HAMP domain-containing sensor histidine kinase [Solirubrobacteraceae bacterium]
MLDGAKAGLASAQSFASEAGAAARRMARHERLIGARDALATPINRLPIRVRLAGTSAALTLVILCIFAAAVGTLTTRRIRADFTSSLSTGAASLRNYPLKINIPANGGPPTITPNLDVFAKADHAVIRIVSTRTGALIGGTTHAPYLGPAEANNSVSSEHGYLVTTLDVALAEGGYPAGSVYLQYARSISDLDKTVGRVQLFLLVCVLGGAGLAYAAGSWIARRAMAPIAELTAAAREVELTRDPNQGIPVSQSEDEVAELGRTLEGMLHALADARAETEAMLERQRAFVADASHELRTPLTSVLANLELLGETLRGDEGAAARSALRSSQRMRRLVADLLLLARADVARERADRPLDLADVIVEAAAELGPVSRAHELELDPVSAPIVGARDDILRVALNLIENALRHTPPGTHVTVGTRPLENGGGVLTVTDNGPGIPAELAPRLFERFVRGAGDRGGSFGLGLAIVAAVASTHGGSVEVGRGPGGGARFVVVFGPGSRSTDAAGAGVGQPAPTTIV